VVADADCFVEYLGMALPETGNPPRKLEIPSCAICWMPRHGEVLKPVEVA
jgi:hypothetical protein